MLLWVMLESKEVVFFFFFSFSDRKVVVVVRFWNPCCGWHLHLQIKWSSFWDFSWYMSCIDRFWTSTLLSITFAGQQDLILILSISQMVQCERTSPGKNLMCNIELLETIGEESRPWQSTQPKLIWLKSVMISIPQLQCGTCSVHSLTHSCRPLF